MGVHLAYIGPTISYYTSEIYILVYMWVFFNALYTWFAIFYTHRLVYASTVIPVCKQMYVATLCMYVYKM